MNRRKFLLALAASAAMPVHAQLAKAPGAVARVAILSPGSAAVPSPTRKVFTETLRELGWIEGRNIVYDVAFAEGDPARLPELAKELVTRRPALIYVQGGREAQAVLAQTRSIPIVFAAVVDPVETALVKSLAKPGGNVTGVASIGWELGGKRMQLLKETLPDTGRVAVLTYSPRKDSFNELRLIEQAAGAGVRVITASVRKDSELDAALAALAEHKPQALLVPHIAFFMIARERILQFAAKHRIPVVAHRSELADDGALLSYSSTLAEQVRRAAHLADKVLKGTKPADIPVEQPTKFELVVNLKTAKALGITIPQSVLLQASRMIE